MRDRERGPGTIPGPLGVASHQWTMGSVRSFDRGLLFSRACQQGLAILALIDLFSFQSPIAESTGVEVSNILETGHRCNPNLDFVVVGRKPKASPNDSFAAGEIQCATDARVVGVVNVSQVAGHTALVVIKTNLPLTGDIVSETPSVIGVDHPYAGIIRRFCERENSLDQGSWGY